MQMLFKITLSLKQDIILIVIILKVLIYYNTFQIFFWLNIMLDNLLVSQCLKMDYI